MLVEGLPPDSALGRAINGTSWQDREYLLHDIDSRIRDLFALAYNIHRDPKTAPMTPDYIDRPRTPRDEAIEAEQQALEAERRSAANDLAALIFTN